MAPGDEADDTPQSGGSAPRRPPDDTPQIIAEGVPRLEALRLRDMLAEAGVAAVLDPDSGLDLGRSTTVTVAGPRAEFARRVIADADAEWVPDDSPAGLVARINEHLEAVRGLLDDLSREIDSR